LIKNSQPFGINFRKPQGRDFWLTL